ncbi:MAG: hypothetical protein B7C54_05355 [Acidimicrobiales bacterium mtb01]|nr:hypothetical protein [Actinomycetota bacterium]TEX46849.1 MAG: hypothetical protein B7C54_05355 [Acidimicrobiales bacterium mtb01]
MCRQVTCRQCGKPSWAGCGAHVEEVLGHVQKDQRCRCDDAPSKSAQPATKKGFFAGLRRR